MANQVHILCARYGIGPLMLVLMILLYLNPVDPGLALLIGLPVCLNVVPFSAIIAPEMDDENSTARLRRTWQWALLTCYSTLIVSSISSRAASGLLEIMGQGEIECDGRVLECLYAVWTPTPLLDLRKFNVQATVV